MPFEKGPYVQIAAICEHVLEEKDGTISLVRIIDRLTHTAIGPDAPTEMPPVAFPFVLFIGIKSGEARGPYQLSVHTELPSGSTKAMFSKSVLCEGEDKGENIILRTAATFPMPGLYWFRVSLNEQRLTSIPFRVIYSRTVAG